MELRLTMNADVSSILSLNSSYPNISSAAQEVVASSATSEGSFQLAASQPYFGFVPAQGSLPLSGPPVPLSSLPALNSLPSAFAQLHLDFDGDVTPSWGSFSPGTTPAYDIDGSPTTFSDTELSNIREIWARVSEKYSPFNINVTTVDPGNLNNLETIKIVIGGAGSWYSPAGGVAYLDSFSDTDATFGENIAFVFPNNLGSGNPKFVAEASAHEAGHTFGLEHQSLWSGTTKLEEYDPGNAQVAPIMGESYDATRGLWRLGANSVSSTTIQDDLAIISSTTNQFGYRVDDHGNSVATSSPTFKSGRRVTASGVIENSSDADYFSFTTVSGTVNLSVSPAQFGGMLDATLELRNSTGTVLSSVDTTSLSESLVISLASGTYYAVVKSRGGYGDIGQYTFQGILPDRFENNDSQATAADIGVAPGFHLPELSMDTANDDDWYKFTVLRPDSLNLSLAFDNSAGNLNFQLVNAAGSVIATATQSGPSSLLRTSTLASGTYFLRVFGISNATSSAYTLNADPGTLAGSVSSTRVLYVNDESSPNDYYTLSEGDDLANTGLSPSSPLATLQAVFDAYQVGPFDLIVMDSGVYTTSATIDSVDEGAAYAGTPFGTQFTSADTAISLIDADFNLFHALRFEGPNGISASASAVDQSTNNIIQNSFFNVSSQAIGISGGSNYTIRNNSFTGPSSYGVLLNSETSATLTGNTFVNVANGIYSSYGSAPLTITSNTFTTGDSAITALGNGISNIAQNVITDFNFFGINSNAAGTVSANDISNSNVGIQASNESASVFGNVVWDNNIGISGAAVIGGSDWSAGQFNDVYNNVNGIIATGSNDVRFNRVHENSIGISTENNSVVHHNVVYRNTTQGIVVSAANGASLVNNTVYATSGDAVRVQGASQNVSLRNNILWTTSGFSLYVTTDSQIGFTSDFNNLFASGTGKVVWWQKEFADLFDWQVESNFDSSSIGYTALNPSLDNPNFIDLAGNNFRLTNTTSTSLDAGDPSSTFSLEPGTNGGRIDLGAYGNTTLASTSRTSYLQIQYPNFYSDLIKGQGRPILWRSQNLTGNVVISLYEVGTGKLFDIATVPASTGSFAWTPPSTVNLTNDVTKRYFIRIASVTQPTVTIDSRENFSITGTGSSYYINDNSLVGDEYATALGNNRNTGRSASDPKSNIIPLIRAFDMGPGDTVRIDTGSYVNIRNVVISGHTNFGDDEGATFTGPIIPGHAAIFDRANTNPGSVAIELSDADFTSISNLTVRGGERGFWIHNDSTNFVGANLSFLNNSGNGLSVENDSTGSTFDRLIASGNGGDGISIAAPIASLSNSIVTNNGGTGINLSNAGAMVVQSNTISGNSIGVAIYNNGIGQSVIGSTNLGLTPPLGNKIFNNSTGVSAFGNVLVSGNAVYNNTNTGIIVDLDAIASKNTVFGNLTGIVAGSFYYYNGKVENNRVYNNTTGIFAYHDSLVLGNTVYSNSVGINSSRGYYSLTGLVANNLVYANTEQGLLLNGATLGAQVRNNTIYQPVGDAILVNSSSSGLLVRNNILWSDAGYALNIAQDSQAGFNSDFNLFYTAGVGKIARWAEVDRPTLSSWFNTAFQDANSLNQDPRFANIIGADGFLGYQTATNDGRDDDFHLLTPDGYFTGSLAPVLNATTGLPVLLPSSLVINALAPRSPGIDRGDDLSAFANETSPNGGYVNLGADGNTILASRSPSQFVLVLKPSGGEVWPAGQTFPIRWRSNNAAGLVNIDLMNGATVIQNIATSVTNSGSFNWSIPPNLAPSTNYKIRVTRGPDVAFSNTPFTITAPVNIYYVNDGSATGDVYTTGLGNDSNDGLSAAFPKSSIAALLNAYSLSSEDTILVDTGDYILDSNITITSDDAGVLIKGPTSGSGAVISRADTGSQSFAFDLYQANDVTLDNLKITGGYAGINAIDSDRLSVTNSDIYGNYQYGIQADVFSTQLIVQNNTLYGLPGDDSSDDQYIGLFFSGDNALITGNTFYDASTAISISGASSSVTGNTVYNHSASAITASQGTGFNPAELITVSGNTVRNNAGNGIATSGAVLVTLNTVHSNIGTGIALSAGSKAVQNTVYGNAHGIIVDSFYGLSTAENNRVFNNVTGILAYENSLIKNNSVYSNSFGIVGSYTIVFGSYIHFSGDISNNLVYANSNQGLTLSGAGPGARIQNNTVYQPVGDAVLVKDASIGVLLRNNILWVDAGYALNIAQDSQVGFDSDYNLLYTTASGKLGLWGTFEYANRSDWYLELGLDKNSLTANPLFINVAGLDGVLGYQTGVDRGADDNFLVAANSPTIDAGDLSSAYLSEPSPQGGRTNLGFTGNTSRATTSSAQIAQVLSPNGFEKYEVGQTVNVSWHTAGLRTTQPVALLDSGSSVSAGIWLADQYRTAGNDNTTTLPIDTSLVTNPLSQAIYQTFTQADYGVDQRISYSLPVPNGSYTVKLHFIEPDYDTPGDRLFDIRLQGVTSQANFDIRAAAGAMNRVVTRSFNVTATGGNGISLDLVNVTNIPAILSALEINQTTAGTATPTVNLDVSNNGGVTWTSIATNQPIDTYGNGSFAWSIPIGQAVGNYLLRVTANQGSQPSDISNNTFSIAGNGNDYYVNDNSTVGDLLATVAGNNLFSGKSPNQPMASLHALLQAYSFGPGDVIHVDTGVYILPTNIALVANDSGVRIEGPASGSGAIINRAYTGNQSFAFDLYQANDVTLDNLKITGGYAGINAIDSDRLSVTNSDIYGNSQYGIQADVFSTQLIVQNNTLYGLPGGASSDDQYNGLSSSGSNALITGNTFYDASTAISISGASSSVTGNTVYNHSESAITASQGSNVTPAELITVSGNTVRNNAGNGIATSGAVLVTLNTVHSNIGTGINLSAGSKAVQNTVYGNAHGIIVDSYYGLSTAENNRVFNNVTGILAYENSLIKNNSVYSNSVGIVGSYTIVFGNYIPFSGDISNNLVYANSNQGLILSGAGVGARIQNNTVYQPVGDAVLVKDASNGVLLRNNILWVDAGYALNIAQDSQVGFDSDYNLLYTTASGKLGLWGTFEYANRSDWYLELGLDKNSLTANPLFINVAGLDGVLGYQTGVDRGADDNFLVAANSPTIDAGDLSSAYLSEPSPQGGRANLGFTGNTSRATTSSAQIAQVLSPNGFEKYEVGQTVNVSWHTAGLRTTQPVALLDSGSSVSAGIWLADQYRTAGNDNTTTLPIDTSLVTNPLSQAIYQTFTQADYGVDQRISYSLPVPNGSYTVKLHFIEPDYDTPGDRLFDIRLQGVTSQANFDIRAAAGAMNRVVTRSFNVTATGGNGISLDLVNVTNIPAILSALEINQTTAGTATPTVNLDVSNNGGVTWTSIATNQPIDTYGNGSFAWSIPIGQAVGNYLLRVTANQGSQPSDISNNTFSIAGNGNDYYVNDNSTVGDLLATVAGNNLFSGKSPNQPMASLHALLQAYSFGPGDVIHVDTGVYILPTNIALVANDSGVRIEGPASGSGAIINRAYTGNQSFAFDLYQANDVTLDNLKITGGYAGINAIDSDRLSVTNSDIYGNSQYGIQADVFSTQLIVQNNTLYGLPGGASSDDQYNGLSSSGSNALITGNTFYDASTAISISGASSSVTGNTVYNHSESAITASQGSNVTPAELITVSGNTVRNNAGNGIATSGAVLVTLNTVHSNIGTGINLSAGSKAIQNTVYGNSHGIIVDSYYGLSTAENNRVFNNVTGILAYENSLIKNNSVYSNSVGIVGSYTIVFGSYIPFSGDISNNLVYANSNQGLILSGAGPGVRIQNNTVYQPVGDAVLVKDASSGVLLRNNILWVDAGYALNITQDSHVGFDSDYNLFYTTSPLANVGKLDVTIGQTLTVWRTVGSSDAHSLAGNPLFADINGADNILGYSTSSGGYDGGRDDNFYLVKNSLAIDSGDGLGMPLVDIEGFGRFDDPAKTNLGRFETTQLNSVASLFSVTGIPQNWQSSDASFTLTLPFAFNFYGVAYNSLEVSTEGFVQFAGLDTANAVDNDLEGLLRNVRIAPLWDNIRTDGVDEDIFVNSSIPNQVTIRWQGSLESDGSPVNVSLVLFSDGKFRFDYGSGNTNLTPTVGFSPGSGLYHYLVSGSDEATTLTSANSRMFSPTRGIFDIGAYEFRGNSSDVTPPSISSTSPAGIGASTSITRVSQLSLNLNEDINPFDATSSGEYELRRDGGDGIFGNNDDQVIVLSGSYAPGSAKVVLSVIGEPLNALPAGNYRFRAFGSVDAGIRDLAGLILDGDGNGTAGGTYERLFTVLNQFAPNDLTLSNQSVAENSASGTTVATLSTIDLDPADTFLYSLVPGPGSSDNVLFSITGNQLKTAAIFDFEAKSSYSIRIQTTDSFGNIFEKPIQIAVNNVNEAPTNIFLSNSSIPENAGVNAVLGTVTGTDPDAGTTLVFSLPAGLNSNSLFNLNGSSLRANASFNFEATSSYIVTLRASDGVFTFDKQLTIGVTNVNEAPSNIILSNSTLAENAGVNANVGTVAGVDPDVGTTLTFSLPVGLNSNSLFNISGTTLRANASFNFEAVSSYIVTLRASDGSLTFDKQITIGVTNVNEPPSNITLSNSSVAENAGANAIVGTLSGVDPDAGTALTFSLPAGLNSNNSFNLNGNSLRSNSSLDFETQSSYIVIVRVSDGVLTLDKQITIGVTNMNDPPSILAPATQAVAGNTPIVFSATNSNAISVADIDAASSTIELTLTAANGSTTLPNTSGLSFTAGANGQASYTVRGTLSNLNAALNGLSFQPNLNFSGAASISLTVNDLGNTGPGGAQTAIKTIAVSVSNPAFIVDNSNLGYSESGSWVTSSVTGFNGSNTRFSSNANAVATWNAPSLAPGYYSVAIWRVAIASNSSSARVTVVHNGITEPAQIVSLSSGASGFVELGTFFFSGAPGEFVRLSQGTPVGILRADSVRFNRLPIANAAPTITAPNTQAVAGNSPAVFSTANSNAISVADIDAGNSTVQLTLTSTNGLVTLPSTAGLSFTVGANGQASFTVRGTIAGLNTALSGLSFLPSLNFSGTASISLNLNDLGNTGIGGPKSVAKTININVSDPAFVVDNSDPGYSESGSWVSSSITGINGSNTRFSSNANAIATWNAPNLTPGYYSVAIWKVAISTNSSTARVMIAHNGITEPVQTVNLSTGAAGFVELGTFFFSGAPGELVRLSQGTPVGILRADSARFTRMPVANAAPTITAPATQAVAGNSPAVFSTANASAISVADIDTGNSTVQLTLAATNGLVTLPSTAGLTFTSGLNGQATFTVRGTLASLNSALNGLSFLPNLNFTGAASISLTVNDLGNTGLGGALSATRSIALTVASPAFVVDNATPGYSEAGTWGASSLAGFVGTTRISSNANAIATWNAPTLAPGYYSVAIWKVAVATNSTNASVTIAHNGITEPAQTVNLATGSSGFVELGTFFFSGIPGEFVRLSQGSTVGTLRADTVRFNRLPIANAAPTIAAPTTQAVAGNSPAVFSTANANAISVADIDTGNSIVQLTLAATNGLVTLPSTAGLTFTSGLNGQATFTVRGTLASLNSALNGLSFLPNLNFTGAASISLTVNDLGNTGLGGALSATRSIALTVASPAFVVDNATPGYVETGTWGASSLAGFVGTSRISSNANAVATWNAPTLAPGYYSVAIWKVAVATNSANASVTIAHNGITEPAQTVNLATGSSGFVELGTFFFSGIPGEFVRLSQGSTVGTLRADTVRFNRLPIANAAPTITAPAAQAVAGNSPAVFSTANANAISVADIDAGNSIVQLTLAATNGLVTLPSTAGLTFTSGLNGQATFTVRGSLASLNSALNGLSFLPNLNFTGAASISLTVNDLGNTGLGGALSATRSIAFTVASPAFVVDNATPGYSEAGTWGASSLAGFVGTTRISSNANAVATWNAPTLAPGYYSVAIWKVAVATNSANASVTIAHNGITEPAQTVNLATGSSGFVELGTFFFSGIPGEFVRLSQGSTVGTLRADSIRFTKLPPSP